MMKTNTKTQSNTLMVESTQDKSIARDTYLMGQEKQFFRIKKNTSGNGNKGKCMAQANINGLMVHAIAVNTCLEKNMGMVNLFSVMDGITMGNGRMGNKMVMGHCLTNKGKLYRKDYGDKEFQFEI